MKYSKMPSIFLYPELLLAIVNFLSYNLKELREDKEHVLLIASVIQNVITERSEFMNCLECIHIKTSDENVVIPFCTLKRNSLSGVEMFKENREMETSINHCPFSIERQKLLKEAMI